MPKIEISHKDLCNLTGKKLSIDELKDAILYAKGEIDEVTGDVLKIDSKDTNRPDLWSTEGIARELKGRLTKETGLPKYKVRKSKVVVKVDDKVSKVRPYTVCAVVKNLKIDEFVLSQMIQLQEKISAVFGRNRKEVAIGVYDLDKIKPPIKYTTVKPDGIKFIPLEFTEELTPREIIEKHPKGKEFGHLLADAKEYPIFIDKKGNVLSVPPLINSDYTGKVTEKTKNVFIECSGFDFKFLVPALNVMVAALADRKGIVQSVKVVYKNRVMNTPNLSPSSAAVDVDFVNKLTGFKLSGKEICGLLEKARYKTKLKGNKIEVMYPSYRQDIMHPRDIAEDVVISLGYNNIEPIVPKIATVGNLDKKELLNDHIYGLVIGLGLQEIMSYSLTNRKNLFEKMNLQEEKIVEIENPVSANWNVFRNWLLPGLLEFLSSNTHVEYPQKIFEVGDVVHLDETKETGTVDVTKLAAAISDTRVSYEDISSVLDGLMRNLGIKYQLKPTEHSSFIPGRVADIIVNKKSVGIIGEIHPSVLENWKIEMPVVAVEIKLEI